MKSILIDSSSAILLYKSGWLDAALKHFHFRTGRGVLQELTIPGYPGAARFRHLVERGRIEVLLPIATPPDNKETALINMGPGERECIVHYLSGSGQFILIDDGRGAAYCRDHRIPYVNALLMPRILALVDPDIDKQKVPEAMKQIYDLGRYAPWVWDYACNCGDATLSPFRP